LFGTSLNTTSERYDDLFLMIQSELWSFTFYHNYLERKQA
jgi:hypothetical protein